MGEEYERTPGIKPTYDELAFEVDALKAKVAELEGFIGSQNLIIADLRARLNLNPRNSSLPPSSEGLRKPPVTNRANRRKAKRRPGKQPGDEGRHLAQVTNPDEVVIHSPETCSGCGGSLSEGEVVGYEVRQVFDLPKVAAYVTEHRMSKVLCVCQTTTKAEAPRVATAQTCYGPSIRALACYLSVYQHVPYDRLSEIFSDVIGVPVSTGAIKSMVEEAGGALGLFTSVITDLLQDAPAVHFDETGARIEGSLHWVHVASTALYTLLIAHKKRGKDAIDEMGVIEKMKGVAVHDGWKPYRSYDVTHALCNAHHVRELQGVVDNFDQAWADKMIDLLLDAKEAVDKAVKDGRNSLENKTLHSIRVRYGKLISEGWNLNTEQTEEGEPVIYENKAVNLLKRLDLYRDDVLRFACDFKVGFTNNQAERDIRMVKLQQKISGSWRTKRGADDFLAIRSYVSTMKKHGYNVLQGLQELFTGRVWLPGGT